MTQLIIVFRAIQGLGAGALVPLAMTIIGDIFTLARTRQNAGFFSGVWGFSSVVGPIVGGFITDQISWRWVFFINLPDRIVAALIIGFALKEPPRHEKPAIDYAGAALLMIAISLLMLALVEGGASLRRFFRRKSSADRFGAVLLLHFFSGREKSERPDYSFRAFSQSNRRRFGHRRISGGRFDVRRDFVYSAFRAGRARLDGDRSRFAFDAADAQLGLMSVVGGRLCC
jgi:hypothetical protein